MSKIFFQSKFWFKKNGFCCAGGSFFIFPPKKFCISRSLSNMSKNGLRILVHLNVHITILSHPPTLSHYNNQWYNYFSYSSKPVFTIHSHNQWWTFLFFIITLSGILGVSWGGANLVPKAGLNYGTPCNIINTKYSWSD